ncbi:hypothetical protein DW904_09780 [Ruminococcus sp. AM42-11]|nr:hypothetical protein DW904_09780 [Ruminococcus sp. AM42-11]
MAKLYNVTDKNREKHDQEARCNSCTSPLLYSQILVAFSETGFPAATGIRLIGKKLCCQDRASFIYVIDGADVKIAVTIPETRIAGSS